MQENNLYKIIVLVLCTSFCITGCQGKTMPELSEEQTALITEYAASALLNNDKSYNTGIATPEEIAKEEARKERELKRAEAAKEAEQRDKEGTVDENGSQMQPTTPDYTDAAQFLGLEGVTFEYQGYEICDSYPPSSETEEFFSLRAAEGKRLMVIKFNLMVTEEKEVDILSMNPTFYIKLGSLERRRTLTTMLLDDLATFKENVTPETPAPLVLVIEVTQEEADSISTIELLTEYGDAVAYTLLQ